MSTLSWCQSRHILPGTTHLPGIMLHFVCLLWSASGKKEHDMVMMLSKLWNTGPNLVLMHVVQSKFDIFAKFNMHYFDWTARCKYSWINLFLFIYFSKWLQIEIIPALCGCCYFQCIVSGLARCGWCCWCATGHLDHILLGQTHCVLYNVYITYNSIIPSLILLQTVTTGKKKDTKHIKP